jgi:hypothetical protein
LAQTKCRYKSKTATEEASTWKTVKCGVPQAPVPGSLLCHIYINDLPGSIDNTSNVTMCAEDTSILTAMKILIEISTKFYTTPQMVSGQSASIKYEKD